MNVILLIIGIVIGIVISKFYEWVILQKEITRYLSHPEVIRVRTELATRDLIEQEYD